MIYTKKPLQAAQLLLLITSFLLLTSCSSVQPVPSRTTEIELPPLDQIHESELGDTLVQYLNAVTTPSFKITRSEMAMGPPVGKVMKPLGRSGDFEYYDPNFCRRVSTGEWTITNGVGRGDSVGFALFTFEDLETEPAEWIYTDRPSIDQRFIYNGRVGSFVKFTYREFSGAGYARDAFTQDVQYDLDEGNIVGFKGARLEIIEASNRSITYKLLSHFDKD